MKIKFSIITPVYNRADCISRCIESIASQDYESYEIIVINDGSSDTTLQKIEYFKGKLSNLRIITYADNKGVNFARNRGIEQARGEFIIFLDSDDILTKGSLKLIEKSINLFPGYFHYLFQVNDRKDDNTLPDEVREYHFEEWLSGKISGDFAHVISPICFNGLMFIEEFRIYESLNWLRVLRQNEKQFFIPSVIFNRERDRADSVTRESILDNKKSIANNYNYIFKFIDWYSADFQLLSLSNTLQVHIKKGILMGIALGETIRNKDLICRLRCSNIERRFYKLINKKALSLIFFRLIQVKSYYNRLKRNTQ